MLLLFLTLASAINPKVIGNPAEWISSDDYPKSEIQNAVTGTTVFVLTVNSKGVVEDCRVVDSSGSVVLDATTCALIKARAKFSPARDANGKKIEGTYRNRARWELPAGTVVTLPPQPQVIAVAVDVDAKGIVEQCRTIEGVADLKEGQPTPCRGYPVGLRVRPAAGADGKPMAYRIIMRQSMEFKPR